MVLKAGATLFVIGISVLSAYWFYGIFSALYTEKDIPILIRVAVPVIILGLLLLITALGWDRLRAHKRENFEEVEH